MSLKILFLTPSVPYPPHTGGQLRSWHILKYLSKKGDVTLISIGRPEQYDPYVPELKKYCRQILFVDPKKFEINQKFGKFKALKIRFAKLASLRPWLLDDFVDPEILKQIENAGPQQFDLIVIRFAVMGYHFITNKRLRSFLPKLLIDIDDVSTIVQERMLRSMNWSYRKLRTYLDLIFLKRYYRKLKHAPFSFTVTSRDREYVLRNQMSQNVFVIPNMFEVNGKKLCSVDQIKEPEMLFCGMMSYPPNQAAVMFFVEKVFPLIRNQVPNAHLTIVGKHTPENIMKLGSMPGITAAGYVPSMDPYYEKAAVFVVPLLNGGGTRIKILEAMSYERPVVSTSIGAEGIDVVHGENILIGDQPEEFARQCIELLQNPRKRKEIAVQGYRLVKEHYDLPVFHRRMDEVFKFISER